MNKRTFAIPVLGATGICLATACGSDPIVGAWELTELADGQVIRCSNPVFHTNWCTETLTRSTTITPIRMVVPISCSSAASPNVPNQANKPMTGSNTRSP